MADGLDFSNINFSGSYAPEINKLGDSITEILRERERRRKEQEDQQFKQMQELRRVQEHTDNINARNAEIADRHAARTDEAARYNRQQAATGVDKVTAALKAGDSAGAELAGRAHGIDITTTPAGPPPVPPDAPPDRPDINLPGSGVLPPELRAILGRGVQESNRDVAPPDAALDAYVPQAAPPQLPTQPPPANGDAVDQELAKANADERAAYDAGEAKRQDAISSLNSWRPPEVRAYRAEQGIQDQIGQEKKYADQMGAFQKASLAYNPSPRTSLSLPTGEKMDIDPEALRTGGRQKAAEDFLAAHQSAAEEEFRSAAGRPPEVASQIRAQARQHMADAHRIAASIASGGLPAASAGTQLEESGRAEASTATRMSEGDLNRKAAMDRALIAASASRVNQDTKGAQNDRAQNRMEAGYAQAEIKDFRDKVAGLVPKDLARYQQLQASLPQLTGGNPLQQKAALYSIGKAINGPGVFTNQDRNDILNYGGLGAKVGNWLSQAADGTLSDEYAGIAADAVAHQLEVVDQRVKGASGAWDRNFSTNPDLQTPEMKARIASAKNGLFGIWGQPAENVPEVEEGAAVVGSARNASGSSRKSSKTTVKTKGPRAAVHDDALNLLDENGF